MRAALGVMGRFRRIIHDDVIARFEFCPELVLRHRARPEFARIPQTSDIVLSGHLEFLRAFTAPRNDPPAQEKLAGGSSFHTRRATVTARGRARSGSG